MKKRYSILIFFLFCTGNLIAQGIKFTASVDKNPVATGDVVAITFSINGNAERFNPPQFPGFTVAGGPNVSQSMEIVNGRSSETMAYSYELMATKVGEFTIGPATTTVNGHVYSTNTVKIKVIKGQSVPQNSQTQNGQAQSGPDNTITAAKMADLSRSIFIRAVVDKSDVYLGQQITLSYRLYVRGVGIEQNQPDAIPELNGFWSEDIKPKQQQVQWRVETFKGQRYNVADLKQSILFPEREGNLTIDPMGMKFVLRVQAPSEDIMDQFFGSFKQVPYTAKSAPVTIHVKPLPLAGKPDSYTGAVGEFTVESSVDKTDLKANDALNYKVKVSGRGNIKLLKTLSTSFPADFDKYDPKITDSVTENENGLAGYRYYDYLLIPRHQGEYTIDPLKFSYFNPATNRYVSLTAKGFHIKVAKGNSQSNVTALSDADKQDVKILDKDIRYIKIDDISLNKRGDLFFGSFWYYILLFLGPCLCYGAYVYRNWLIKTNSDVVMVKSRKAGKVAAKHLASAQMQLQAGNSKAFYEDVFSGLYGYLSDKLNLQYANLNKETIASAMREKKVSSGLLGRLQDTLDLCEMARYAPVTHISESEVFEKAKSIINDIENEI